MKRKEILKAMKAMKSEKPINSMYRMIPKSRMNEFKRFAAIFGFTEENIENILSKEKGHYKIFCVNGNTGFRNESRIFYFIHLQNEEAYERKESSSA